MGFERGLSPACVGTLGPQAEGQFWKVMEASGGVALLEEVGHWREGLC